MNAILQSFAQVLLKERYNEYVMLISQFQKEGKRTFAFRNRAILEKGWLDVEASHDCLTEEEILKCFAIHTHYMYIIDWSGEEYLGQVKRSITMMLKKYGIEKFNWDTKKIENSLDWTNMRRGNYLPLLFSAMNKELDRNNFSLVLWDDQSDCFNYTILPTTDFLIFDGLEFTNGSYLVNAKTYNIYLTDKGDNISKVMLYLKKLFTVPLSEIKEFYSREKIFLAVGNIITVKKFRKEIEELGGRIEVEESSYGYVVNNKITI